MDDLSMPAALALSDSPTARLHALGSPAMMSHDHRFIRDLVQLHGAPRVRILWLLLPWAVGTWWSASVARALVDAPLGSDSAWAFVATAVMGRFLLVGGLGTVATWVWLYFAWPEHPRVLCWAAAIGFVGLWIRPTPAIAVVPLFVSLCMCAAIAEQAWAMRRAARGRSRDAPAV
jgi:hypothetical protein